MSTTAAGRFWAERDEYHDLAETFERNIVRHHPQFVTSRRMCSCLKYFGGCNSAGTGVDYWRYNGPSV